MSRQARCSVVIPAYGPSAFLATAIRSIGPEDADEIVVIDDGGPEACRWVVDIDPRVVYYRQINSGVAVARNQGILRASGEVVALLDQDDVFTPNKCSRLIARMVETGSTFAYSGFALMDGKGRRTGPGWGREVDYEQLLSGETGIQLSALVVSKAALSRVGLFDPDLRYAGDQKMALRLLRDERGCFIADELIDYRLHDDNASRRHRDVAAEMLHVWRAERQLCDTPSRRAAHRRGMTKLRTLFGWQSHDARLQQRREGRHLDSVKEWAWGAVLDPRGSATRAVHSAAVRSGRRGQEP